jgi:peptide/nickel transport system substrate-binding protein
VTQVVNRRTLLAGVAGLGLAGAVAPGVQAQALKGGKPLRIALLNDFVNYDPHQFSAQNATVMRNLYDTLIEYDDANRPVPALAERFQIAPDNMSCTVVLRQGVMFHSGAELTSADLDATLKKANDPKTGKNVYPTMSVVKDWTVVDGRTVRFNFKQKVPDRQVTDLLQFMFVIAKDTTDSAETKVNGTGPYTVAERQLGQRLRLTANPKYWRAGQPIVKEVVFTIFSDNEAAAAALESGAADMIFGGGARHAVRLRNAGFQLLQGQGQLVQVFRINTTRGPFRNAKFRQAFNHLIDRAAILRVGYAGVGEVTALPWAPANPAADRSYDKTYAFDIAKGQALLKQSGLSQAEMNDWTMLVNSASEDSVAISQVVQASLKRAGIDVKLELKQGAEYVDALLGGKFFGTFGGVGNVQKFPTRITTNSIYRVANNPVLGTPHPHPDYVAAIQRVETAFGTSDVKAAYDALNKALVEASFGIATNTFDVFLTVAAKNIGGFTRDIDSLLVLRTIGFTS